MIAIDTNILIYSVDRPDPVKRAKARALLRQCRARRMEVVIPWQVQGEFLRFLRSLHDRARIRREDLERIFRAYFSLFPTAIPTTAVFERALDLTARYSLSHWDSMLLGACLEAGVTTLYTEDMGAPIVMEHLQLVNPFL